MVSLMLRALVERSARCVTPLGEESQSQSRVCRVLGSGELIVVEGHITRVGVIKIVSMQPIWLTKTFVGMGLGSFTFHRCS